MNRPISHWTVTAFAFLAGSHRCGLLLFFTALCVAVAVLVPLHLLLHANRDFLLPRKRTAAEKSAMIRAWRRQHAFVKAEKQVTHLIHFLSFNSFFDSFFIIQFIFMIFYHSIHFLSHLCLSGAEGVGLSVPRPVGQDVGRLGLDAGGQGGLN